MTPQQVLRYQIILLLASNGRNRVISTLADVLKMGEDELEANLVRIEQLETKRQPKSKGTSGDGGLERLAAQYPDKAQALRLLSARFINKTFLSELREVRRFFDTRSMPTKSLKSRSDALPKLLSVLATLSTQELTELCEQPDSGSHSSLGIISDQILGRNEK
jgi:hypothetical protein